MMGEVELAKADRAYRVRCMAERIYVAAAPTLFAQVGTDREAADFAFEVAEAFEQAAEARAK